MSGEIDLCLKFEDAGFNESMSEILVEDRLIIEGHFLHLKIKEIFSENKFNTFRNFCEINRVKTVGDLNSDFMVEYFYGRGIGPKKVENVLMRLKQLDNIEIISNLEPALKYIGFEEISLVFGEQSYLSFVDYCAEHEKVIISDLDYDTLIDYSNQKGVGRKKFKKVLDRLEPYKSDAFKSNLNQPFSCGPIFEKVKMMSLAEVCQIINFDYCTEQDIKIRDMEGKRLDELKSAVSIETLIPLVNDLQKIKTPTMIFDGLEAYLTQKTDRDWKVLKLKAENGATLQSVADQMDLTRERVRQLINKTAQKLDIYFTQNQLIKTLKLYSRNQINISFHDFLHLVGEDYKFILKTLADYSTVIHYMDEFKVFYFEGIDYQRKLFENWVNDLPELFNFYKYQNQLSELIDKLQIEKFSKSEMEEILSRYGYKKYGEAFSKNGLTIVKVAEYLFENYFKEPFKLDDEGVEIFERYAKKHLDFDYFEGNIRNLDARFRDSKQIIAIDSFTYIWFDGSFNMGIIAEIDEYINRTLEVQSVINATEIYEGFKEKILPFGVTSPYHLYYIVKYYLDDKYQIGRGNTLEIYRDEDSMMTAEENLIEFLEKCGGVAKKDEICQALKWEVYRVEQRVGDSSELVMWNGDSVRLMSKIDIKPSEIYELKLVLARLMQAHYTTGDLILKEMEVNDKLAPLLQREGFDNPLNLVAYCKKIANLKGHTSFLAYAHSRYDNIYDVIFQRYNKVLSRNELRDFLTGLGYGEQMPGTVIKKLLEDKRYVEVDIDEICNVDAFSIRPMVIKKVLEFIQDQMGNQEYLSLSNLINYEQELPKIEFPWTPQLIKTILINRGYKQIEKTHPDYRYEKIIIVKESSELNSFEELLHYILKNEYTGDMHESNVYSYLEEKGIVKKQDRIENKTFSQRTLNGELIEFEESGFIKLKE